MRRKLCRVVMVGIVFALASGARADEQDSMPWYVGIGLGAAWYQDMSLSGGATGDLEMDTGFTVNLAVGRYFDDEKRFRAELEGIHDRAEVNQFAGSSTSGDIYNYGMMLNLLYDIHTGSKWVPFVGGGLGFTEVSVDKLTSSGTAVVDDSDVVFSWQLKAGVAYQFNPKMALTLGYRYFDTNDLDIGTLTNAPVSSDGASIQNLELGFRYHF